MAKFFIKRPEKSSWRLVLTVWLGLAGTTAGNLYAEDTIRLERIRFQDWQEKLESYPPDIVVVDFWATWCISCIERFPHMVDMQRRYRSEGIRFVSMCLDERDDTAAIRKAEGFLRKLDARFEHYLMDENLMQAFEMLDLIGIPVVAIYDREGKERFRLTGDNPNNQFTDRDVEAAIQTLLEPAS